MVFMVVTVLFGLKQFFNFPRQEDPPITIREIVVHAFFPGMEPMDVEQLITRKLEAQIRTLPEMEDIWSDSKTGIAVIHADTRDEYDDLDLIWQKIRNKMADIKPELPQGTIGPFINDEFGLTAVATVALWSEGFSMAEMRPVARDIRDRLYELDGIRKVELWGVQEEQVFLKFSTTKLSQYGISIGEIVNRLVQTNVVLPGGKIDAAGQDIIVEPSGNFKSLQDIEDVLFQIPGTKKTIQLKDLLMLQRGYIDPPNALAYFKGKPAIVISVSITPGVNAVAFGERLTRKVKDLESQLPIGYVLEYATFQPDLVEKAVNGALSNVYQTLVIVLVVVVLFLGVRTGLIVGSFVPMTMLLGLIVMGFFGVELERVSIASAIIALGMLVDNGIVVAEDPRHPPAHFLPHNHLRIHAHASAGWPDRGVCRLASHGRHYFTSLFLVSFHVHDTVQLFLFHEGETEGQC
jgi:multidrug efflux pump subunit AcrB